jgi:polar amino acid transport system ATP-binding protein
MLRRLAEGGMTIVVITHHLGFAEHASDYVVFLDHGAVLQAGPIGLLRNPVDARVKRFVSVL